MNWEKKAKISTHFTSFKVYIIGCYNDTEKFIKIGKIFNSIKYKFHNGNSIRMPYNYKILRIIEGSAKTIFDLEHELHRKFKHSKYTPQINFGGDTECFLLPQLIIRSSYIHTSKYFLI